MAGFAARLCLIHASKDFLSELYAGDAGLDGPGESGPESAGCGRGHCLSPIRLDQSLISPGRPVG
jgi:hypothetical protein